MAHLLAGIALHACMILQVACLRGGDADPGDADSSIQVEGGDADGQATPATARHSNQRPGIADAVRFDIHDQETRASLDAFKEAEVGEPEGNLVPGFVTSGENVKPTDHLAVYEIKEKAKLGNHFTAELKVIDGHQANLKVLKATGKFKARLFGHHNTHITNPHTGKELFQLRMTRHNWNPLEKIGRNSFRIFPPGTKKKDKILYTINRDYFGRGVLGRKEVWRIYRGQKRDGKLVMYCIGSWWGWNAKCYHSEESYRERPKVTPAAELSQNIDAGAIMGGVIGALLPDKYYLTVKGGEDAGLLVAWAMVVDSVHDKNMRGGVVPL